MSETRRMHKGAHLRRRQQRMVCYTPSKIVVDGQRVSKLALPAHAADRRGNGLLRLFPRLAAISAMFRARRAASAVLMLCTLLAVAGCEDLEAGETGFDEVGRQVAAPDWDTVRPYRTDAITGSPLLNDIDGQLPLANQPGTTFGAGEYRNPADLANWAHEATHGVNARVRNEVGRETGQRVNAFYVGGGRACVLREPRFRKSDVAAAVPAQQRGPEFARYLAGQAAWDDRPLYILDEWVASTNGSLVARELGQTARMRDSQAHAREFVPYVQAVAACCDRLDPAFPDRQALADFIAWNTRRIESIDGLAAAPLETTAPPKVAAVLVADALPLWPVETELIAESNRVRAQHGLRPLRLDPSLQRTARQQSWTMTTAGMTHGFTSGWSAENIAMGQPTARDVVRTWLNSPGHRANLLGNYTRCGMAGYRRGGGSMFWTQQFGR